MAEEESPFIEEAGEKPEVKSEIDTQALVKELEALNITDTKGVQDMAHASQQTGRAWNEVGELRNQVNQLQQQLTQRAPAPVPDFDGEPVDIQKVVKNAVRDFYIEEVVTPQKQATQQYYQQVTDIENDIDYQNPTVVKMWKEYVQTPNFQQKMQMGQTTMKSEYDKLVRTYFREIATRSEAAIKGLTELNTGKTPYVESGETRSNPTAVPSDDRKEAATKIDKQRREGTLSSDDALHKLVETFLPKDDPIWRKE